MKWTYDEVARHTSRDDCYVILYNKVYDLTKFLPEHPGGASIILKNAGKDATVHPKGTIEQHLSPECCLGELDTSSVPEEVRREAEEKRRAEEERRASLPPLTQCLNMHDFEQVGRMAMSPEAWAYYSSAADDNEAMHENEAVFRRIWFRPRVLRDVKHVDPSTYILGIPTSLPIYVTATALGRMGHPEGEKNLTRAAARTDLIQMIPTLASCTLDEIVGARDENGAPTQFFQMYVNADRRITLDMIRRAERADVKALFVTVDAPQLGRREKDMRMHFSDEGSDIQKGDVNREEGAARAISTFIDPSLTWEDVLWIRNSTHLPVLLKGVQTWEDAVIAAEMGLAGVVLSNHGGRQLDFARSGMEVLAEVVPALKARNLYGPQFQVLVDGGFRRGTDVLKAIALGATAVGIGRPLLYAYSAYGVEGAVRAINLLRNEIEVDLGLIGARTLKDVVPEMLDLSALHARGLTGPVREPSPLVPAVKTRL